MAGVHAMMIVDSGGSGGCMEGDKLYLKPNSVTIAAQCGVAKGKWHSFGGKDFYVAVDYDDLISVVSVYKGLAGAGEVLANLTRDGQTKAIPLNQVVTTFVDKLSTGTSGGLFTSAKTFNQTISSWDTSNVSTTYSMFEGCFVFNQPLNSWDVSNVSTMDSMFYLCNKFNQDIGGWNVSNVVSMSHMFNQAKAFNQDISSWCVSNIKSKPQSFDLSIPAAWTTAKKPKWGAPC